MLTQAKSKQSTVLGVLCDFAVHSRCSFAFPSNAVLRVCVRFVVVAAVGRERKAVTKLWDSSGSGTVFDSLPLRN